MEPEVLLADLYRLCSAVTRLTEELEVGSPPRRAMVGLWDAYDALVDALGFTVSAALPGRVSRR